MADERGFEDEHSLFSLTGAGRDGYVWIRYDAGETYPSRLWRFGAGRTDLTMCEARRTHGPLGLDSGTDICSIMWIGHEQRDSRRRPTQPKWELFLQGVFGQRGHRQPATIIRSPVVSVTALGCCVGKHRLEKGVDIGEQYRMLMQKRTKEAFCRRVCSLQR